LKDGKQSSDWMKSATCHIDDAVDEDRAFHTNISGRGAVADSQVCALCQSPAVDEWNPGADIAQQL